MVDFAPKKASSPERADQTITVSQAGASNGEPFVIRAEIARQALASREPFQPRLVSATDPDWSRETVSRYWDPAKKLLRAIRRYQRLETSRFRKLRQARWVMAYRFWSIVTGADIPLNSALGGGLALPHPNGIVIHPSARIGPNCLIFQQVTIGTVADRTGAPIIDGHVDIGAGAKILGPVRIGAHALIGANAVVLRDVPPHAVAVGIPAKSSVRRASTSASTDDPHP